MIRCPVCSANHLPTKGHLTNGIYACTCENCGHFFKFRATEDVKTSISFTINGVQYTVGNEFDPATSLLHYMRDTGVSRGTKGCCYEGGCGVCLVTLKLYEPILMQKIEYSVNSCCLQLYTCDGMEITTVEGLGNPKTGLHPIQERMVKYDGSQCGFCSPGQVMNMYGLLKKNPKPTVQQIEDEFDATICRCTGYRPILDAMKSFAVDAPANLKDGVIDIEELDAKLCKKTGKPCKGQCGNDGNSHALSCSKANNSNDNNIPRPIHIVGSRAQWLKPTMLDGLVKLLDQHRSDNYRLVFGNTGFGVFKELGPWNYDVLIDTRGVQEMYGIDFDPTIVLGANLSLSNLIELFDRTKTDPSIPYGATFARHLKHVAQHGIRNMACWAGNLMLKKYHPEFPSDLLTLLETISAKLIIYDSSGGQNEYSLQDFLKLDMKGKVIVAAALPTFSSGMTQVETFKTSPRLQASHAYVAAGFNFEVDASNNYLVKSKPNIVIQGISSTMVHAVQTEGYLTNKALGDPAVLATALKTLSGELVPESYPMAASPTYRKSLAISMFYKFALGVCKAKVSSRYVSGGTGLDRTPVVGTRDFETKKTEWPVTEPIPKITAPYLTSGMVQYVADLPPAPGQLTAAVVISTVGNAKIDKVDASAALQYPGVVAFIQASDIPEGGANNWRPEALFGIFKEELLSSGTINYAGQPIGIVVADLDTTAQTAAAMVKVTYKDIQPPIIDIHDGIQKKSFFPDPPGPIIVGDAEAAIASAPHKISGNNRCGDQYHFHMENQATVCHPTDLGGMRVMATTQWLDGVQDTVAQVLGLAQSDVTVETQRLGGGFGAKITQNFLVSGLCALAAYVTGKPVKLELDLHTNMKMMGKRTPYYAEYEVGFDDNGKLLGLKVDLYGDIGWYLTPAESFIYLQDYFDNAYFCPNWLYNRIPVKTNKPVQTPCRSPGSTPTMFIMESIMDHVASALGKDQLEVRKENLYVKGQRTPVGQPLDYCSIRPVVAQLEADIMLDKRKQQVADFNKNNRWKKRGLAVMPNRFGVPYTGGMYNTHMTIYHCDGSIGIAHGGIDVGQGINTKVIQVCAYEFGIPMDKIRVMTSSTVINANSVSTGAAITSELACKGVIESCKVLKERMAPVKAVMTDPTWEELVNKCYEVMIDLTASYMTNPHDQYPAHYSCYSAACVEAEVDVLTGQYQLRQMDMLYDCGESINPELDMGQAEGAYVMGLGYFLQEELKYDSTTGQVLNAGTWEYKPPMPKDLPMNFNFKFLKNAPNPLGVLRSKAVGEPPLTMAAAAVLAIKRAIEAARAEIGQNTFFALNAPATVEKVQSLCLNDIKDFTYGN